MKIGSANYNIEKEFNIYLKKVNRKFMYDRCRAYKVRIKKDDELPFLCYKYLLKKKKMKPWEYPDDENGNAVWLNRLVQLEDKIALYIFLKEINSFSKKNIYNVIIKNKKKEIKDFIISCIEYVEETEYFQSKKKQNRRYVK